jgi:hypothetical protein
MIFPRFDCSQYFLYRNVPLKYALNGVEAEDDFGVVHLQLFRNIKMPNIILLSIFEGKFHHLTSMDKKAN